MASTSRSDRGKPGSGAPGSTAPGLGAPDADTRSASDPRRPDDHVDATPAAAPQNPRLSPVGWLRFAWRLLTSMRTALVLLLLLALAAVPGSLVPQRSSDPNGVIAYARDNPELFEVLDALGLFSTFSSPWFSAIYLLLFVSLIGCILPRTRHHLQALRARPPRTPARLERLAGFREERGPVPADRAVDEADRILRRLGYRVERYEVRGVPSVSAERGYLRETGNLVFHASLVGVLVGVAVGGLFGFTGQRILVEGEPFTNVLLDYDSITTGSLVDPDSALDPYSLRLDSFEPEYALDPETRVWHPLDFDATVAVREPGGDWESRTLKVNSPLSVGGTEVYLLGNGYAPVVTVRDPDGGVVATGPVPFLPQNAELFSVGVVKVPDGLTDQLGMIGLFYPAPIATESGAFASFSPIATPGALLSLEVYRGDLGLDEGVAVNAYQLDTAGMEELAGRADALVLGLGETLDLPEGLGSVTFDGWTRFVSLDIHHDPARGWVLAFAVLAVAGLLTSLAIPRRRMWVKAFPDDDGVRLEYAGLARGEDPGLASAVEDLARRHAAALGPGPGPAAEREPRMEP